MAWRTSANLPDGAPPTRWVGESASRQLRDARPPVLPARAAAGRTRRPGCPARRARGSGSWRLPASVAARRRGRRGLRSWRDFSVATVRAAARHRFGPDPQRPGPQDQAHRKPGGRRRGEPTRPLVRLRRQGHQRQRAAQHGHTTTEPAACALADAAAAAAGMLATGMCSRRWNSCNRTNAATSAASSASHSSAPSLRPSATLATPGDTPTTKATAASAITAAAPVPVPSPEISSSHQASVASENSSVMRVSTTITRPRSDKRQTGWIEPKPDSLTATTPDRLENGGDDRKRRCAQARPVAVRPGTPASAMAGRREATPNPTEGVMPAAVGGVRPWSRARTYAVRWRSSRRRFRS